MSETGLEPHEFQPARIMRCGICGEWEQKGNHIPAPKPQEEQSDMTITQKMRGRSVTPQEAAESARRLINSHFNNPDQARCSIPANPADDDLIVTDFIREHSGSVALHESIVGNEEGQVCPLCGWSKGKYADTCRICAQANRGER